MIQPEPGHERREGGISLIAKQERKREKPGARRTGTRQETKRLL